LQSKNRKSELKKRTLTGIIVLMSVSLTGIILVQLLWMKNAIEVKEKQFDRSVNDALVDAVKTLQKKTRVDWVADKVWDTVTWKNNVTFFNDSMSDSDIMLNSGSGSYVYVSNRGDQRNNTISVNSSSPRTVVVDKFKDKNFRSRSMEKIDSLKSGLNTKQFVVLSEFTDSVNVIVNKKISQITTRSKSMDEALNELVFEISTFDEPPELVYDSAAIAQTLRETLKDKDLDIDFEFAVYNPETDSLESTKSQNFNPAGHNQFKTRLYPESYFGKPEQLILDIPGRRVHLLRSLGFLFSGSMLFTFIILVTFYITIKVILRQKKISQIKSDFINNMTHEFKTPIATISLAVDSINNPKVIADQGKIKYFTGIIGEENKRMNNRVENVLQMSLVEKQDFNLQPEPIDAHDLIREVAKNFRLQLEKKGGKLEFDFLVQNATIEFDKTHFANVISNLIDNAIKYSEQPEIRITTRNRHAKFVIEIEDNGIGMSREEQQKVFGKFYRVAKGNIHNVKGFGLGLSYVKAMMDASGGTVKINSTPGKGSTFILEIA